MAPTILASSDAQFSCELNRTLLSTSRNTRERTHMCRSHFICDTDRLEMPRREPIFGARVWACQGQLDSHLKGRMMSPFEILVNTSIIATFTDEYRTSVHFASAFGHMHSVLVLFRVCQSRFSFFKLAGWNRVSSQTHGFSWIIGLVTELNRNCCIASE